MNTKNALLTVLLIVIGGITSPAHPVSSNTERVPLPEEVSEAINSSSTHNVRGEADLKFHINDAGTIVLDSVHASSQELSYHIWKRIHGLTTNDTTLAPGKSYSLRIIVK